MNAQPEPNDQPTYRNPVYGQSFPDPFVIKYCGVYWAYCTGGRPDGGWIGVLRSLDLVRWQLVGSALPSLPDGWPECWAPEVTYANGRFYMYYSLGNEEHMELRVAVATHPAGPFADSGHRLTAEPFAIDAHLFTDDDGARYLFYATDFLSGSHIGTGTVRDRMRDPFTLAGAPQPVTLPRYDWHVYDPQRVSKGGVRWHTVEGSYVLKHKGRYYQMFSGGNWQNVSYGVSYATTNDIASAAEWQQAADGVRVLPVLGTIPGEVIGPGHNSVVRGPDNQQLFCVYHRWTADLGARAMAIDPLDWAGERLLVLGPSTGPQPVPLPPSDADQFAADGDTLGAGWAPAGGRWSCAAGEALQRTSSGTALAHWQRVAACFVAEVSLRALGDTTNGGFGVSLWHDHECVLEALLAANGCTLQISGAAGSATQRVPLPADFDPGAYHLLRLELDGALVRLQLDDQAARWQGTLAYSPVHLTLHTQQAAAAFAGFALTVGWQDDFMDQALSAPALGWNATGDAQAWQVHAQALTCMTAQPHGSIRKGPLLDSYLLVVNARLDAANAPDACYGFLPAAQPNDPGPLITLERAAAGWALVAQGRQGRQRFPLPAAFDPLVFQQFRFRKTQGRITIQWEAHTLGILDADGSATNVGLYAHQARAAFDMVRVTAIT